MTEGNAEPTPGLQGPAPAHKQLDRDDEKSHHGLGSVLN